jgi:putative nucleotidyltransferase with HDIG domain
MRMATKLRILVCQQFACEAAAVAGDLGDDISIGTYPDLCMHPQAVKDHAFPFLGDVPDQDVDTILVGVCHLNCQALGTLIEKARSVHHFDQCFHMLAGREFVDMQMRRGAYLLTPGWLDHWEPHLAQWGFDREMAQAFFRECTRELVLLDTGVGTDTAVRLQAFAAYLDLPAVTVPVGLDHFRLLLQSIALQWRVAQQQQQLEVTRHDHHALAEYTMAFDLLAQLTRNMDEPSAIQTILSLPAMLFGAGRTFYIPVVDGQVGATLPGHGARKDAVIVDADLQAVLHERPYLELPRGFYLRIAYLGDTVGILGIDDLPQPERLKDHLNLALMLSTLCGLAITNARSHGVRDAFDGIVQALATIGEWRDPYTAGHQRRVAQLAVAITRELGGSTDDLMKLRIAGLLHDIGKVVVPSEILAKPGKLLSPEFDLIKLHSQVGYEILGKIPFAWPIAPIVQQHHLRLDGTGYAGDAECGAPLFEARILMVADVVEAMMSHRPYRPALGIERALDEIEGGAGQQYDADVVVACARVCRVDGFQLE